MSKKNENKVVETETTEEIENTEGASEATENITPNVEASSPAIEPTEEQEVPVEEEKMVTLKVNVNFTDKYNKSIKYVEGKKYEFKKDRAEELLNDPRKLVSKAK